MMQRSALAAMTATLLAGCSMAPDYARPSPAVPVAFPQGGPYPSLPPAGVTPLPYQAIFRDTRLQAVIGRALANNQDLQIALANVRQARGQLRIARAGLLPAFGGSAGASIARNRGAAAGFGNGGGVSEQYSLQAGLTAFEIDLFGRVRSGAEAARNDYLSTVAGVRAARLTLIAETASAWYTLATDRSLLAIADDTVASAARSVELTGARVRGGIAARTDLRQAETVLRQAESDRADLRAVIAQDENALELLVGAAVTGAELPASIESVDELLGAPPAGLDSRVLLGRPDVVQAEYTLRAANAQIGVARAAYFPTISLTGLVGLASTALGNLFSGDNFIWNAGADGSVPIFQGGALRGNVEISEAQRDSLLAQYRRSIQTAFREVADALARNGTIDEQVAAQTGLEAAARDSLTLAEARYREGIDAYLLTLDAQRTLYSARRSVVATRLVRANNRIDLYRALGGGDLIVEAIPALPTGPSGGDVLRGRDGG